MGEFVVIDVADNAALKRAVNDAIARAQVSDPLAPVTLVVDSAAQAWTLRRQIAEAAAPGTGIANVRAMTLVELLSLLADRVGVTTPASTDRLLEAAVVEALLRAETGPLSASADHPETALRLSSLADELAWCRLDAGSDARAVDGVSLTARAAIDFAADARPALASALGTTPWPDVTTAICAALSGDSTSASDLGSLIVICGWLPAPVQGVLKVLAAHAEVTRVVVSPDPSPIPARVLDFPDPAREAAFAVRLAADALATGASPGRVAILYSADTPYARLLERALDDACVAWHGPTGQTLQSTTVAR